MFFRIFDSKYSIMFKKTTFSVLAVAVAALFSACCASQKNQTANSEPTAAIASPKAIIYQTKADYSRNVPVMLSEDKKSIVSYPGPRDVFTGGELAYPSKLADGWFLDNRGIGANVAFLKYTYEEYSKMAQTPSATELYNAIIDKDPIKKMYFCGPKGSYQNIVDDLNQLIEKKDFSKFKKIK